MKSVFLFIWHLPRNLAISLVLLYQKTFSPDHSKWMKGLFPHGHCKFQPTCSDYSRLTYQKNGFIIGAGKTIWRLLRCHPWAKGGIDLP
ncbi:membrane protein insertion efficiency factor YidD [Patescibacteria group bacterium]|nr:membrane protein insertion efficiency factor YidD [Patescibacteria group bacterium]